MSMRASAMRCSQVTVCSETALAEGDATTWMRLHHLSPAPASATPTWCACSDGSGPGRGALARSRSRDPRRGCRFSAGTRTFSRSTSEWPCGASSIAEDRSASAQDLHARCVSSRHEDLRLLHVAWLAPVGIGLAHDDGDLAARVTDAGRPPLAAVDDVVVAVALGWRSRCWWHPRRRPPARS